MERYELPFDRWLKTQGRLVRWGICGLRLLFTAAVVLLICWAMR